jgi:PIN domain nuclease of toxin-antitoxin system
MGIQPQVITWTRAGPRRLDTGTQPAAEDNDSELWVSLIGLAMIHKREKWICHSTHKITIKDDLETALQWTKTRQNMTAHPEHAKHAAALWPIVAERISFR